MSFSDIKVSKNRFKYSIFSAKNRVQLTIFYVFSYQKHTLFSNTCYKTYKAQEQYTIIYNFILLLV